MARAWGGKGEPGWGLCGYPAGGLFCRERDREQVTWLKPEEVELGKRCDSGNGIQVCALDQNSGKGQW